MTLKLVVSAGEWGTSTFSCLHLRYLNILSLLTHKAATSVQPTPQIEAPPKSGQFPVYFLGTLMSAVCAAKQ